MHVHLFELMREWPRVAGLKEANGTNIMGSNMISLMYVSSLSIGAPLKRDNTYATLAKAVEPLGMNLGEGWQGFKPSTPPLGWEEEFVRLCQSIPVRIACVNR